MNHILESHLRILWRMFPRFLSLGLSYTKSSSSGRQYVVAGFLPLPGPAVPEAGSLVTEDGLGVILPGSVILRDNSNTTGMARLCTQT